MNSLDRIILSLKTLTELHKYWLLLVSWTDTTYLDKCVIETTIYHLKYGVYIYICSTRTSNQNVCKINAVIKTNTVEYCDYNGDIVL